MQQARQRVLGIGGLFFRSKDPDALARWYHEHLGVDRVCAETQYQPWKQAAGDTVFQPFAADTDYFGSPTQAWMINFRVSDLDAMVAQLRAEAIEVKVDPEDHGYGRFARLHDPEGNPIELWQPAAED